MDIWLSDSHTYIPGKTEYITPSSQWVIEEGRGGKREEERNEPEMKIRGSQHYIIRSLGPWARSGPDQTIRSGSTNHTRRSWDR